MTINDFDIACEFYRTQVNKAFTPSYEQKLNLCALFSQSKHGPFSLEKASDIGPLDFVGKERRARWQALGTMSESEAQDIFVQSLIQICPQFAAHLDANNSAHCQEVAYVDPQDLSDLPPNAVHGMNSNPALNLKSLPNLYLHISRNQETQIRNALNVQTQDQFRAYAAQYYPDNEIKQAELIAQLQDRHFHQYMVYITENSSARSTTSPDSGSQKLEVVSQTPDSVLKLTEHQSEATLNKPTKSREEVSLDKLVAHIPDGMDNMVAPQMWTRKDISEFKALLSKDPDSVINVGSGELVTIRVPVIQTGNCLVWEFATDYYDIGFGLSFEWPTGLKDAADEQNGNSNVKNVDTPPPKRTWSLVGSSSLSPGNQRDHIEAATEEIIPVYRRTSHTEVYCGSHVYPATSGTYLLKFDNTYSLWRNKMLYYRVYCTQ